MKPITANTSVLAIFGDPVGHSLSPVMHNGWIEDHGLDAVHVALPLKSEDPVAAFRALKSVGLRGANVTVPHKEAAARAADRSDASVANVLRWEQSGLVSAFNTDGLGFIDALTEAAPDWRGRVRDVLILGAGGAAKGIADALSDHSITVANRTFQRAEELSRSVPRGRAESWHELERAFSAADLIVQTTTLGMHGNESPDWPVHLCRANAIVVDIVYRPLETPLLKAAAARGLIVVDGLGMLIHQGARAFKLWFDIAPDTMLARQRLLAALGEHA
ncbi:MAG: shikimate dehydrogenase [Pseudomonadota bacterium]